MGEAALVQEADGAAEVARDGAHLVHGVGVVAVVPHEVEHALAEHLEGDAGVAVVVEVVQHADTQTPILRVIFPQLVENVDLQLGSLAILLHILDDFQSDCFGSEEIVHLEHLAEGALAQEAAHPVPGLEDLALAVDQVTLAVLGDDGGRHAARHAHVPLPPPVSGGCGGHRGHGGCLPSLLPVYPLLLTQVLLSICVAFGGFPLPRPLELILIIATTQHTPGHRETVIFILSAYFGKVMKFDCTLKTDDRNENMSRAGVNVVGGVWGVGTRHQHQLTVRRLSPAPARAWPVVCTGLGPAATHRGDK